MTAIRFFGVCFLITIMFGWSQGQFNLESKRDGFNTPKYQPDVGVQAVPSAPSVIPVTTQIPAANSGTSFSAGEWMIEPVNYFLSAGFISPAHFFADPSGWLDALTNHWVLTLADWRSLTAAPSKRPNRAQVLLADFRPQEAPSLDLEEPQNGGPTSLQQNHISHPAMDVDRHSLRYYRNLMRCGQTPKPEEMVGMWRGVNKGVATVAIDRQFIKEFYYVNGCLYGDNISVCQVQACALPHAGWQPRIDPCTGEIQRQGRFAVECPQGCGPFRHGMVLNYAAGGNGRNPSRRVWDQVVKLDDNHLLGRATIRVGFVKIPVAFFVLERISMSPVEAVPTPVEVPVLQISAPQ